MNNYPTIKKTTWRGAKVQKLLNRLKVYQTLFENPAILLEDLLEDLLKEAKSMEVSQYSSVVAIETISKYIKEVFQIEEYEFKDFNKKIFSGAKVVSVLQYIDFSIIDAEQNIERLEDHRNLSYVTSENRDKFTVFLKAKIEKYEMVKKWILYGVNEDNIWNNINLNIVESIIFDIENRNK